MMRLAQSEFISNLKALGPAVVRTVIVVVQAMLISAGLAGAGELLGAVPVWLRSLVSEAPVIESEARTPGKRLPWRLRGSVKKATGPIV